MPTQHINLKLYIDTLNFLLKMHVLVDLPMFYSEVKLITIFFDRPTMAIDDGTYLCQISTHPPTILVTNLKIIGTIHWI